MRALEERSEEMERLDNVRELIAEFLTREREASHGEIQALESLVARKHEALWQALEGRGGKSAASAEDIEVALVRERDVTRRDIQALESLLTHKHEVLKQASEARAPPLAHTREIGNSLVAGDSAASLATLRHEVERQGDELRRGLREVEQRIDLATVRSAERAAANLVQPGAARDDVAWSHSELGSVRRELADLKARETTSEDRIMELGRVILRQREEDGAPAGWVSDLHRSDIAGSYSDRVAASLVAGVRQELVEVRAEMTTAREVADVRRDVGAMRADMYVLMREHEISGGGGGVGNSPKASPQSETELGVGTYAKVAELSSNVLELRRRVEQGVADQAVARDKIERVRAELLTRLSGSSFAETSAAELRHTLAELTRRIELETRERGAAISVINVALEKEARGRQLSQEQTMQNVEVAKAGIDRAVGLMQEKQPRSTMDVPMDEDVRTMVAKEQRQRMASEEAMATEMCSIESRLTGLREAFDLERGARSADLLNLRKAMTGVESDVRNLYEALDVEQRVRNTGDEAEAASRRAAVEDEGHRREVGLQSLAQLLSERETEIRELQALLRRAGFGVPLDHAKQTGYVEQTEGQAGIRSLVSEVRERAGQIRAEMKGDEAGEHLARLSQAQSQSQSQTQSQAAGPSRPSDSPLTSRPQQMLRGRASMLADSESPMASPSGEFYTPVSQALASPGRSCSPEKTLGGQRHASPERSSLYASPSPDRNIHTTYLSPDMRSLSGRHGLTAEVDYYGGTHLTRASFGSPAMNQSAQELFQSPTHAGAGASPSAAFAGAAAGISTTTTSRLISPTSVQLLTKPRVHASSSPVGHRALGSAHIAAGASRLRSPPRQKPPGIESARRAY
eukprot:NODE_69_length_3851_cov_3.852846.p1 GENE.NODE_69_length_3851_cov_3.852846~~NODE_69_length_3851_cov_3.852846.p1  ORF type:complete len:863 (-),score=284.33 NODE_69_length_3851_cov_3.852846:603-3191(-)